MTTEQRLQRLERSATRWRFFAIALLLLITARVFIGANFIPNEAKFDKVTTKQLVVDGDDAWITLKADGPEASIECSRRSTSANNSCCITRFSSMHVARIQPYRCGP
jgi:hypothetical protein